MCKGYLIILTFKEFEETLRTWNQIKQGKIERLSEPLTPAELEALDPVASAMTTLVRRYVLSFCQNSRNLCNDNFWVGSGAFFIK